MSFILLSCKGSKWYISDKIWEWKLIILTYLFFIHLVADFDYSVNPLLFEKCLDLHKVSMRQIWLFFKVITKLKPLILLKKHIVYDKLFWLYLWSRIINIKQLFLMNSFKGMCGGLQSAQVNILPEKLKCYERY